MLVHPNIKGVTGDEFELLRGVQSLEDKTLGLWMSYQGNQVEQD